MLQRLGWDREQKDWNGAWKDVHAALAPHLGDDAQRMHALHSLLRHLGQELCRAAEPQCAACPLRETCPTGRAAS